MSDLTSYTFRSTGQQLSIQLQPAPGKCAVLIGRNGSGKTTLLRAFAGSVLADKGRPVLPQPMMAFTNIERQIHMRMTAIENVRYLSAIMGVSVSPAAAKGALSQVNLAAKANTRAARLSKGQKKRLILAIVVAADWGTVLLDEPTNGLDHEGTDLCLDVLAGAQSRGACVILSSHDPRVLNELDAELFAPSEEHAFKPVSRSDLLISEKFKVTLRDGQTKDLGGEDIAAFLTRNTNNVASLQSMGVEIGTR